jgi:hypothetical protein
MHILYKCLKTRSTSDVRTLMPEVRVNESVSYHRNAPKVYDLSLFFKFYAVKTDKIIIYFSEERSGSIFKVKQSKNVFFAGLTLRTDPMWSSETLVNYLLVETA